MAQIDEWREGKTGRYAFARILTDGAPTTTATCSEMVNHHRPPTEKPFRCIIRKKANGNGYAIADIIIEGLEAELFAIPAIVIGKMGWDLLVEAQPLPDGQRLRVTIPSKLLSQQQIEYIEESAEVTIDAVRSSSGYVATQLHHPTVSDAFTTTESPQTIIAFVKNKWPNQDKASKGCHVTFQAPGASVTASFWIQQSLLKGAGISAIRPWDKVTPLGPESSSQLLDQWQAIMRNGSPAEAEELEIDRLELQLEWVESNHSWRVCRLCRPRALREPQGNEIIDWVEGMVISDRQALKPSANPVEYVDVSFQDSRVGRGTVRLMGQQKITHAALAKGTKIIFSLVSKGNYWNVKCLHQSVPVLNKDAP